MPVGADDFFQFLLRNPQIPSVGPDIISLLTDQLIHQPVISSLCQYLVAHIAEHPIAIRIKATLPEMLSRIKTIHDVPDIQVQRFLLAKRRLKKIIVKRFHIAVHLPAEMTVYLQHFQLAFKYRRIDKPERFQMVALQHRIGNLILAADTVVKGQKYIPWIQSAPFLLI